MQSLLLDYAYLCIPFVHMIELNLPGKVHLYSQACKHPANLCAYSVIY